MALTQLMQPDAPPLNGLMKMKTISTSLSDPAAPHVITTEALRLTEIFRIFGQLNGVRVTPSITVVKLPPTGEEHTPLTRTPTPVYDGRSIICRSEYIGFYDVYCWWQKWKRRRLAACTFTIFWWPRRSARFGIRCSDLCESKNQRDGPLVLREEQRLRLFSAYQSLVIR